MYEYLKPTPAVVYLDPKLTDVLCYGAWKFASESEVLIRQIDLCISNELMSSKKSVFMKIQPAFERKMKSRY